MGEWNWRQRKQYLYVVHLKYRREKQRQNNIKTDPRQLSYFEFFVKYLVTPPSVSTDIFSFLIGDKWVLWHIWYSPCCADQIWVSYMQSICSWLSLELSPWPFTDFCIPHREVVIFSCFILPTCCSIYLMV